MKNDKEKRLVRLLRIVLTLDQGSILPETFAEEESISLRTFQRDMVALQQAGLPLVKLYNSRWAFMEGFNLRNITKTNAVNYTFLTEILNVMDTYKADKIGKKSAFAEKNKSISNLYSAFAGKLYAEKNYKSALNLYKRALSFNKQDMNSKLFLAKTYIELKDYKNALKTLQAPSETPEISKVKILCYMNLEQDEKALQEMDTCLNFRIPEEEGSFSGDYQAIDALYYVGKYEKALEKLKKWLHFPVQRKNIFYLYHLYLRLHNLEGVKKHFTTYNKMLLNELNSKDIYHNSLIGHGSLSDMDNVISISRRLEDKEKAAAYAKLRYEKISEGIEHDISGNIMKIYNSSDLYLPPDAKTKLHKMCNDSLKKYPTYENYFARALVEYMFNENQKVQEDFKKCLEGILKEYKKLSVQNTHLLSLKRGDFDIYYSYLKPIIPLPVIEKFKKEVNKLKLKFANSMLKENSSFKQQILLAGRIFHQNEKHKEALSCFKRILGEYDYITKEALARICTIYKQDGDENNFKKYYSLALEKQNEELYKYGISTFALWGKAVFLYDVKNYKTALLYFKKALDWTYFTRQNKLVVLTEYKEKFLDCCRKLNDAALAQEFAYLYNTSIKYPLANID